MLFQSNQTKEMIRIYEGLEPWLLILTRQTQWECGVSAKLTSGRCCQIQCAGRKGCVHVCVCVQKWWKKYWGAQTICFASWDFPAMASSAFHVLCIKCDQPHGRVRWSKCIGSLKCIKCHLLHWFNSVPGQTYNNCLSPLLLLSLFLLLLSRQKHLFSCPTELLSLAGSLSLLPSILPWAMQSVRACRYSRLATCVGSAWVWWAWKAKGFFHCQSMAALVLEKFKPAHNNIFLL